MARVALGLRLRHIENRAPLATDDASQGIRRGHEWAWDNRRWECASAAVGAAVWNEIAMAPDYQPADPLLTAMAALVTAADRVLYFTGADAPALATLTSFARTLLDDADQAAARNTLGAQAQDADLDAIAALASSGMAARTGAGTWATRFMVAPAAGFTITAADGATGNPTFVLSHDLAGLEALGSTGIAVRTAADTWAVRSLTAPAAGFSITNPAGVLGNISFTLTNDLAAVEGLAANGIAVRTGTDAWAARTITASNGVAVTHGDGVAGAPAFTLTGVALALHNQTTGPGWIDGLRVPRTGELGSGAFASIERLTGQQVIDGNSDLQWLPQHHRCLIRATSGMRTHVLPASADLWIGWTAEVWNRSGNNLTLNRSGTDAINAAATSYVLATGAAVTVTLDAGGQWEIR